MGIENIEMKNKKGFVRLGIVIAGILIIGFIIPFLQIFHFSQFNSGVSTVIGVIALVWLVYWIISWVSEGFTSKEGSSHY